MNYKYARDHTLELIDQYSVAGARVEPSYNNQADYLHKIPALLDDAQILASSAGHRLGAEVALEELEREVREGWTVFTLPEDFWKLRGSGPVRLGTEDGSPVPCRLLEGGRLAVPKGTDAAGLMCEYYRWPRLLGEDPAEDAELDNTPYVQAALPYYAAAHLVMLDNSYAYTALMGEFERRLAMAVPCETRIGPVADAYREGEEP